MPRVCYCCFRPVSGTDEAYHPRCLRALFDSTNIPKIEAGAADVERLALVMIGRTSVSGVQKKLSMALGADGKRLEIPERSGRYILKPRVESFDSLPENEAVSMCIANAAGIEVPPLGLFPLADQSLAYVIRRFDRLSDGSKCRVEDFCQLSERPPKDKYDGSAERCAKILRRFASAPVVELAGLFKLLAFSWWVGNEDLHLKNLSLLEDSNGLVKLTPAYDIVCTAVYLPERELGMPMGGKDRKITRKDWLRFAERCDLTPIAASKVLDGIAGNKNLALELIGRSPLPERIGEKVTAVIEARTAVLES